MVIKARTNRYDILPGPEVDSIDQDGTFTGSEDECTDLDGRSVGSGVD